MRIESIELTNYGPFFGSHSFSFADRGLVLVMGTNDDEPRMNSNGAGKSSIFDALDWCLFGRIPRGDHADSVINEESNACTVQVNLTNDVGNSAHVVRSRGKKSILTFVEGTIDRTALDTKETQVAIERYLGLDRDVFHAAVLFGQTDLVHYAESTDAERMEILTKILQLDEIDGLLENVKAKFATADNKAAKINSDLQSQIAVLDNLNRVDFTGKIQAWEEARIAELAKLKNLKSASEEEAKIPQTDAATLPSLHAKLLSLESAQKGLIDPSAGEVTALAGQVNQIDLEKHKKQYQLDQLQQQVAQYKATLSLPQSICISCGQAVSREHIETKLRAVEADIVIQTKALAELITQSDILVAISDKKRTEYDNQIKAIRECRNEYTRSITELRGKIKVVELQQDRLQKAIASISNIECMIVNKEKELNPFLGQQQENTKSVIATKARIDALKCEATEIDVTRQYLNFWVTGLGPKGLKSYILDSRLQELTDAANQWVKVLTGGTIWVQFESQKQTRGNKLVNSPDVRVCRWNPDGSITERNFRSWSGGEKQRISFAVDFGLSRLIASRAKQSYDLLILDEVFRHLDSAGKEAVMEMLQMLSGEKSSVLVVEHDTEFQDAFEQRVVVRKTNRRSIIVEADNGNKENKKYVKKTDSHLPVGNLGSKRPVRSPISRTPAN